MPAIKLKKVTAEYLAEKEQRETERAKKKNLEDVAKEQDEEKVDEEETEEKKHNFLEVEILFNKRKRCLPPAEQKLVDWYTV